MEALRILRRQTLQQFLRTRPQRTNLQRLQSQTQSPLQIAWPTSKTPARSLHTRIRASLLKSRNYARPFNQVTRGTATSTETSTQNLSLSDRLKKLSREYGWSALGVYLLLSALDFPFCFLAVRLLGTDRIGHWEHVVVSTVKEWIKWPLGSDAQHTIDGAVHEVEKTVKVKVPVEEVDNHNEKRILEEAETFKVVSHGYNEAEAANKRADASIWTQLALAYAIHKSFIFVRVPLTAAVLPKVVKTLRSWGYNIGKRPVKKVATNASSGTSGVNTKGSGVKSE